MFARSFASVFALPVSPWHWRRLVVSRIRRVRMTKAATERAILLQAVGPRPSLRIYCGWKNTGRCGSRILPGTLTRRGSVAPRRNTGKWIARFLARVGQRFLFLVERRPG